MLRGYKVYFGTGLASSKEVSCGFGFELLSMVLTALLVREETGADAVLHEIGTVGYDISEAERDKLISEQTKMISSVTRNLGTEKIYYAKLSHSYQSGDFFSCILRDVKEKTRALRELPNFRRYGKYIVLQIAQMKYLYEIEKARIKVGWIIGQKPVLETVGYETARMLINQGHLNEYYFDSIYRYVFPEDGYEFIYTPAGMDMVNGKRYSPYTVTKSQNRPLLTEPIGEYIKKAPDSKYKAGTLKLYEKTVADKWERLFGAINAETLAGKLEYIQEKALGMSTPHWNCAL